MTAIRFRGYYLLIPFLLTVLTAAAPMKKPVKFLDKDEESVLAELNLARTKPSEYARFLEAHRKQFRDDKTFEFEKRVTIQRQEGVKAVDEAIAFLKQTKPLPVLAPSEGLSLAALDHVEDIGPKGAVSHDGSDGSKSEERMNRYGKWLKACGENLAFGPNEARFTVIQLIVDDGVPGRGHRKNIFDSRFTTVGISIGAHKVYKHMCVMDFAGGYRDDKSKMSRRRRK